MTSLEDVAGTTPGPDRIDDTHGTQRAIRRHERDGETLCEECRVERNRLAREYYRLRKEKS